MRNRSSRRSPIWIALVAVAVLLAACGTREPSGAQTSGATAGTDSGGSKQLHIAYVTKSATNPGWKIINQGAEDAARDLAVKLTVLGPSSMDNVEDQVRIVEDLITQKVDAIALAPVNSAALAPAAKKAIDAGIPVIAVDTAVEGQVTSFVATDSYSTSTKAAEWLGQRLGGKGTVILVQGDIAHSTGADRRNGFAEYLNKNYPDVKIVQEIPTKWDSTEVLNGLQAALQAHPDVDAVYTSWGSATVAAYQALKAANLDGKVILTGWCSSADCSVGLMKKGALEAAVSQFLYNQGYMGIETAVKAARGETVPERVDTGYMLTTPQNIDEYLQKAHISADQ